MGRERARVKGGGFSSASGCHKGHSHEARPCPALRGAWEWWSLLPGTLRSGGAGLTGAFIAFSPLPFRLRWRFFASRVLNGSLVPAHPRPAARTRRQQPLSAEGSDRRRTDATVT